MMPNQQKEPSKNPNSDAFITKLGAALVDLSDIQAWRTYLECEETFVRDLQDMVTTVPLSSQNYSERLIFLSGMVEGIKRMILRRRDILVGYKKKKEEDIQHDGTSNESINPGTTYGHSPD